MKYLFIFTILVTAQSFGRERPRYFDPQLLMELKDFKNDHCYDDPTIVSHPEYLFQYQMFKIIKSLKDCFFVETDDRYVYYGIGKNESIQCPNGTYHYHGEYKKQLYRETISDHYNQVHYNHLNLKKFCDFKVDVSDRIKQFDQCYFFENKYINCNSKEYLFKTPPRERKIY